MSTSTPDGQPSAPIVPAAPAAADEPRSLRLEDWLIVLTMAALALITFVNVVLRYFTDASFAWTEEISVFLMIVLAMVGGSEHRRQVLAQFGALMVALLFGLITVLSIRVVWDDYRFDETSPGIGVPQWWYTVWLPVLCALTTARALQLFARLRRASAASTAPKARP